MARGNTKERILEVALDMFSVNGYDGVSVRMIAGAVGIKESSLYKHYKSKQDIFDSLLISMQDRYLETSKQFEMPQGAFDSMADDYQAVGMARLKEMSHQLFLYFLKDPYASKFRHMLEIEQYRNKQASEMYAKFFIEAPIEFQAELFKIMMDKGYFKPLDPKVAAYHFYSTTFVMFHYYDNGEVSEGEVLRLLDAHIEQFSKLYANKD